MGSPVEMIGPPLGAAGQPVKPRHHHHVEGKAVEHLAKLNTPLCHKLRATSEPIDGNPASAFATADPNPISGLCTLTYPTTKPL
jgi:hypothetical protein